LGTESARIIGAIAVVFFFFLIFGFVFSTPSTASLDELFFASVFFLGVSETDGLSSEAVELAVLSDGFSFEVAGFCSSGALGLLHFGSSDSVLGCDVSTVFVSSFAPAVF
jgi:hypothetical protein